MPVRKPGFENQPVVIAEGGDRAGTPQFQSDITAGNSVGASKRSAQRGN